MYPDKVLVNNNKEFLNILLQEIEVLNNDKVS